MAIIVDSHGGITTTIVISYHYTSKQYLDIEVELLPDNIDDTCPLALLTWAIANDLVSIDNSDATTVSGYMPKIAGYYMNLPLDHPDNDYDSWNDDQWAHYESWKKRVSATII